MKRLHLGRFDRMIVFLLVGLGLVLAGAGLAASLAGLKPPELVSQTVSVKGPIGLTFSQKMSAETVQSRLSLEPAAAGRISWDGKTLWYWPDAVLRPGQSYTLRLAAGAKAEDGQEIRAETSRIIQARAPQVIFLSPAAAASEIWIANPDGSGQTQLTQTGAQVIDYGMGYDGSWIAYSVNNPQKGKDLWVMRRDGSDARKLIDCGGDSCTQPAWSPDGKRIAYSRIRLSVAPGEVFSPVPRIWTVDLDNARSAALFQDPAVSGTTPLWSPDGKFLAFYSPTTKVIHALNIETGQDLLFRSQMGAVGSWTADSSHLFYGDLESSDSLPYGSGYMADIQTDEVTSLFNAVPEPEDTSPPAPAPDGSWVVVGVRSRGGSHSIQLFKLRPDGSESQAITSDHLYTHGAYSVDPAGEWVLYQRFLLGSSTARPEIWVWEKATGSVHRVMTNATQPAWLP